MAVVFISYKSEDKDYAKRLYEALQSKGIGTFWDKADLKGGDFWERRLYEEIEASYIVVVLISKKWLEAPWTIGEYIVARYTTRLVIPVLIDDGVDEEQLRGKLDFNVQRIKTFDVDAIVKDISAHLQQSGTAIWQGDPYPGLTAFGQDQSAIFFGRSEEIWTCLKEVDRFLPTGKKALVIQAASGMGKSSLLQAGIIPQLKAAYPRREVVLLRPGAEPKKALMQALRRAGSIKDTSKLSIDETIERIKQVRDKEALFLCIDQAEEMFALPKTQEEKEAFLSLLGRLVFERDDVYLIATLRADFSHLMYSELLSEQKNRYKVIWLDPLTEEGLRDIIVKPTRLIGVDVMIDDVLVERLIHDFSDSGMLPLLAYTLRNLYLSAKVAKRKTISSDDYGRYDLANVINDNADEAFAGGLHQAAEAYRKNESDIQIQVRHAFINFAIRYEGDKVLKQKVRADRLSCEVVPVFDALVDARLMIKDNSEQIATYEFVHETVFHYWNKLSGWIEEGRDFLRIKRRVDEAYALWEACEETNKDDALLHGLLLDTALPYKEEFFDERLRRFIEISNQKRERERKSRRNFMLGSFASISAFGAFSSWEWYQTNRVKIKVTQQAILLNKEIEKSNHYIGLSLLEKAKAAVQNNDFALGNLYAYGALDKLSPKLNPKNSIIEAKSLTYKYPYISKVYSFIYKSKDLSYAKSQARLYKNYIIHTFHKKLYFINLETMNKREVLKTKANILSIFLERNTLYIGSYEELLIFNLTTTSVSRKIKLHNYLITQITTTNTQIVLGTWNGNIILIDKKNNKIRILKSKYTSPVQHIIYFQDYNKLIITFLKKQKEIVDLTNYKLISLNYLNDYHIVSKVNKILITYSSRYHLNTSYISFLNISGLFNNKELFVKNIKIDSSIDYLAVSNNRKYIYIVQKNKVKILDINTGKLLYKNVSLSKNVVYVEGNEYVLIAVAEDGDLMIYDLKSDEDYRKLSFNGLVLTGACEYKSYLYATFGTHKNIEVFDLQTYRHIFSMKGHRLGILCLVQTENLLISSSYDSTIRVWDVNTFKLSKVLKLEEKAHFVKVVNKTKIVCATRGGHNIYVININDWTSNNIIINEFIYGLKNYNKEKFIIDTGKNEFLIYDLNKKIMKKNLKAVCNKCYGIEYFFKNDTYLILNNKFGVLKVMNGVQILDMSIDKNHNHLYVLYAFNSKRVGERQLFVWKIPQFKKELALIYEIEDNINSIYYVHSKNELLLFGSDGFVLNMEQKSTSEEINKLEYLFQRKIDGTRLIPKEKRFLKPLWSKYNPYYWIERAKKGNIKAMYELALLYDRERKNNLALHWYVKSAQKGCSTSEKRLQFLKDWNILK